MKIRYFAWLREQIGRGEEEVELPPTINTIDDLIAFLKARGDRYAFALKDDETIRVAVDHHHAERDHRIENAREIALFPPMTGG